ncbi:potassium-transporting ATPase subunit KdpA [Phycicoccus sp. HDW14]|uniref:potassium-transporting ATPase subunit KdpA n=1 Tax=Phycicoccus sp. HDW14 TaxID=2714941 RepID=UPI00140AF76F|nr:potassium-transporting ATPase subunit KdpA [Phycicoccus sp. HDW14]QIM22074.1 potassium-transporting ATPase subunit KdpA [Phycicoccus sp. HDW14]
MSTALQTAAAVLLVAAVVAAVHVPLGTWMHRVFTDDSDWRIERVVYRLVGVDPRTEQRWTGYAGSVLAFAVASVALLFVLITVQGWMPWSLGRSMDWHTALDTAVSFTTNTNWQAYAGEAGAGHAVQMLGLTTQNFVSAATGLAVAVAVVRGLARVHADRIGNFWVDLTRATLRVLLPLAAVAAVLLLLGGVVQNLASPHTVETLTGVQQTIQGGPVASQEAIKELGTNGGGFFNANSAHPFENPGPWTNLLEIVLILVIPFSLPYTYGLMVGDRRQGAVATGVMGFLLVGSIALTTWAEAHAAAGPLASMEGKEQRFGVVWSSLFASVTTGTSTGAVNAMHDSLSPLGGGVPMVNMLLGELSPGGVGTGLYSYLVVVVLAVFIAGLMVGRTPELLGKTIGRTEVTSAALVTLTMPALVLLGTGLSVVLPVALDARLNDGPHGLSELMYAVASASNNNGSAFAGLSADQPYLNLLLAGCMFVGRFVPIVLVLRLAGSLAAQGKRPVTAGTMPTHTPLFTTLVVGTVVIVAGLTFFPSLALGPIAEALS